MKSSRILWIIGSLTGFLAVALGAFGAHALRQKLSPEMLVIFDTGARYQLVHSLAILASAHAAQWGRSGLIGGWLFTIGVLLFSGSLYVLSFTGIKEIGAITPLGGICLLSGWVALSLAPIHWRNRPEQVRASH